MRESPHFSVAGGLKFWAGTGVGPCACAGAWVSPKQPVSGSEADELGGVVYPELLHQASPVVVNCLRAHAERFGDLRVGLALDDEQVDLPLAVCQPLEGVYLPETRYSVVSIEVKGSLE
jgi:hypothetical protein